MMLPVLFTLVGVALFVYFIWKKPNPNLPPGPKPLPFVGNLRDLPPAGQPEYKHWLKFKDIYGPISSVTILGQSIILIHDRQAAHDLLEKASLKTSGRPYFHFGGSMCGYGSLLSLLPYNDMYRSHRKMIHRQLGTKAVASRFHHIQDLESHRLLMRALDDPGNLMEHIKIEARAIILRMTYGYSVEPRKPDPLVRLIEAMMHSASLVLVPLRSMIDILPMLEHLPEHLPGMSFKKSARERSKTFHKVVEAPYRFVQQQMAKGAHQESYVSSLLGQGKSNEIDHEAIKLTAAIMFGAGGDTTVSTIQSFVLAMTLFPEVLKKAQTEIESVIGTDRLPQFTDRQNLPYVNALVKEALRWVPVTPLSLPHVADEEIEYGNLCIPKGACLLPGVWWFLHDPDTYSNPSSFDPDRYLVPRNEPDPATEVFGYGRRICPGRFLADDSLFITISRLAAAFDIGKAVDDQGNYIDPEIEVTPGLIAHPLDFPYKIKPRNARYADMIRSIQEEHPWDDSDASLLPRDL